MLKKMLMMYLLCWQVAFAEPAPQTQPHEVLKDTAKSFLKQQLGVVTYGRVEIEAGDIDKRLRLPYCHPDLLSAYLPKGGRPLTTNIVGVRCEGAKPWSIFIPMRVKIFTKVLVTNQPLSTGSKLSEANIDLQEMDVSALKQGYFESFKQLQHQEVKRPIRAGKVLTPYDIKRAKIIKRGEIVRVSTDYNGIRVSMQGKAMMSAGLGEIIQIRSLSSDRVIQGVVAGPKNVDVKL